MWFLSCRASGETLLIDAAAEPDKLIPACEDLNVRRCVTTHGHWDHIGAVTHVRELGIPVAVNPRDASSLPAWDEELIDGKQIPVGQLTVDVMATPGHTPGSCCFTVVDSPVMFSGDTLFPGGPGATRFPNSSFVDIMTSLRAKLFGRLADDTTVFPGHGLTTTIGDERPNLQEWEARGW